LLNVIHVIQRNPFALGYIADLYLYQPEAHASFAWAQKYKKQGLVVIGVHSPEYEFEKVSRTFAK